MNKNYHNAGPQGPPPPSGPGVYTNAPSPRSRALTRDYPTSGVGVVPFSSVPTGPPPSMAPPPGPPPPYAAGTHSAPQQVYAPPSGHVTPPPITAGPNYSTGTSQQSHTYAPPPRPPAAPASMSYGTSNGAISRNYGAVGIPTTAPPTQFQPPPANQSAPQYLSGGNASYGAGAHGYNGNNFPTAYAPPPPGPAPAAPSSPTRGFYRNSANTNSNSNINKSSSGDGGFPSARGIYLGNHNTSATGSATTGTAGNAASSYTGGMNGMSSSSSNLANQSSSSGGGGGYNNYSSNTATAPPGLRRSASSSSRIDPSQMPRPDRPQSDVLYHTRSGTGRRNAPSSNTVYTSVDTGACSPRLMRATMVAPPTTKEVLGKTGLPFAILATPFASPENGEAAVPEVDLGPLPPRCSRCAGYVNPFVTWTDQGNHWTCNLCSMSNETPSWYFCSLDGAGARMDQAARPELHLGSVDFVVNEDYCVRDMQEPVYVFAVDVSERALANGLAMAALRAVRSCLQLLRASEAAATAHQQRQRDASAAAYGRTGGGCGGGGGGTMGIYSSGLVGGVDNSNINSNSNSRSATPTNFASSILQGFGWGGSGSSKSKPSSPGKSSNSSSSSSAGGGGGGAHVSRPCKIRAAIITYDHNVHFYSVNTAANKSSDPVKLFVTGGDEPLCPLPQHQWLLPVSSPAEEPATGDAGRSNALDVLLDRIPELIRAMHQMQSTSTSSDGGGGGGGVSPCCVGAAMKAAQEGLQGVGGRVLVVTSSHATTGYGALSRGREKVNLYGTRDEISLYGYASAVASNSYQHGGGGSAVVAGAGAAVSAVTSAASTMVASASSSAAALASAPSTPSPSSSSAGLHGSGLGTHKGSGGSISYSSSSSGSSLNLSGSGSHLNKLAAQQLQQQQEEFKQACVPYQELAAACAHSTVCVSVLACVGEDHLEGGPFLDTALMGEAVSQTGGQLHFITGDMTQEDNVYRLEQQLLADVASVSAAEAVAKMRTSVGVRVDSVTGPGIYAPIRGEVELCGMDCFTSLCFSLCHDSALKDEERVHAQLAVLHTSPDRRRLIRVLNLTMLASQKPAVVFRNSDIEAVVVALMKQAVQKALQYPLSEEQVGARAFLDGAIAGALLKYRQHCSPTSPSGQLILPEALKVLPVYTLGMLKHPALFENRCASSTSKKTSSTGSGSSSPCPPTQSLYTNSLGGSNSNLNRLAFIPTYGSALSRVSVRAHERAYELRRLMAAPVVEVINSLYPRVYNLFSLLMDAKVLGGGDNDDDDGGDGDDERHGDDLILTPASEGVLVDLAGGGGGTSSRGSSGKNAAFRGGVGWAANAPSFIGVGGVLVSGGGRGGAQGTATGTGSAADSTGSAGFDSLLGRHAAGLQMNAHNNNSNNSNISNNANSNSSESGGATVRADRSAMLAPLMIPNSRGNNSSSNLYPNTASAATATLSKYQVQQKQLAELLLGTLHPSSEIFESDQVYLVDDRSACFYMFVGRSVPAAVIDELFETTPNTTTAAAAGGAGGGGSDAGGIGRSSTICFRTGTSLMARRMAAFVELLRSNNIHKPDLKVVWSGFSNNDPLSSKFATRLIEDSTGGLMSYVDYLCNMHTKIQQAKT